MEQNNIWTDIYQVRTYEADFKNKLKIENFANYIQESASRHASHRKVGFHELIEKNCVWMLSKLKIEIEKYPHIGEKIRLETWVDGKDRLYSYRDFHFYNEKNELIAAARTGWLILDIEKKRLRAAEEFVKDFPANNGKCIIKGPIQKIESIDTTLEKNVYKVLRSDLDILQHTNNVVYIKFLFNTLGNTLDNKSFVSLEINFNAESKLNDELKITFLEKEENKFLAKIFNTKELVKVKFELRNIN
jgi:acyl-ACP thioesterase